MWIRTKRKGAEVISDLHHFTNKWQEVPDGEVRVAYTAHSNLELRDEKPAPPKKAKKPEVKEVPAEKPEETSWLQA